MATANKTIIKKRSDVDRRLTYTEMDNNFEQLKLAIDDIVSLETIQSGKLAESVYNAKMLIIDGLIEDIQLEIVSLATKVEVNLLAARVDALEDE